MTQNGWSVYFCTTPELKPFFLLKDELSVEQGCLMWSLHTVIPTSLQEHILSELHKAHPGVVHMKSATCSHIWWPWIDSNVKEKANSVSNPERFRKQHYFSLSHGLQLHGSAYTPVQVLPHYSQCSFIVAGSDSSHEDHHCRGNSQCYAQHFCKKWPFTTA